MHFILALSLLNLAPARLSEHKLEGAFQSSGEAANASAHAAWGIAVPLAGYAVDRRRGLLVGSGAWIAYSLVNEFLLHGKEASRERNMNLGFRILPCLATSIALAW